MTAAREELVFSDAFDSTLDPEWTWLREHPGFWRLQDGLEIRVEPGVAPTVQNALLRPAPDRSEGVWAIEVTVYNHTHPIQQYEQAGITWYQNGKPIFKQVKELIDGDLYIIPGRKPMPTQSVRLRLLVTADSWEAQYRPEGEDQFHTADQGELPPSRRRSSQHPVLQRPRERRALDPLSGLSDQTPRLICTC